MNKNQLGKHFQTAMPRYRHHAHVQHSIAKLLFHAMLPHVDNSKALKVLEIGVGSGFLTTHVDKAIQQGHCHISQYILNDLFQPDITLSAIPNPRYLVGDIENVVLPNALDMVLSASTLQWLDDLPTFFAKLHDALSPAGMVAFSSFLPSQFIELKHCLNVGLNYPTLRQWQQLCQPYFNVVYTHHWQYRHCEPSPKRILQHISDTGVNAVSQTRLTPQKFRKFSGKYQDFVINVGQENRYPLTYAPIIMVLKKRPITKQEK